MTGGVGVFDTENEGATYVTGISPVKQTGTHHTDVGGTGGRRTKTYANITAGGQGVGG